MAVFHRATRRMFLKTVGQAGVGLAALGIRAHAQAPATNLWTEADAILKRIVPPTFPSRTFEITRYGATAGSESVATAAFRSALDGCHDAGGGPLVLPGGPS